MTYSHHLARRQSFLNEIGEGIAIISTTPESFRNRDTSYPYRHDSYFWYLSGFTEPDAVIVLKGGQNPRSILFCREKNEERETWDGFRYGPQRAAQDFYFDEAYAIDEFNQLLPELLLDHPTLWFALGHNFALDQRITKALRTARQQNRNGQYIPSSIHDPHPILDHMRLIKDAHEISTMRKAAKITATGHLHAMQVCQPGMMEYELEAELSYFFRRSGATAHAFPPIVASGKDSCILHYIDNNKAIEEGTLVLIDAGCEFAGYAADMTRTFPANGKFNPAQRDVYEIVLAAQKSAIQTLKPDTPFITYHEAALRVLVQGLVDLRILKGNIDGLIEQKTFIPFYMHRTGHWLGIDVHDAGVYNTNKQWTILKPGMVLTVEPGLYIRPSETVPKHFHNIGIRIEDNVFITQAGHEVYTDSPREITDIEDVMKKKK